MAFKPLFFYLTHNKLLELFNAIDTIYRVSSYCGDYFDNHFSNLSDYRAVDNPRTFLVPIIDEIAKLFDQNSETVEMIFNKNAIIGLRACDLHSFDIMKKIFGEYNDFFDPIFYKALKSLFIVSFDCSSYNESCHCTLLDHKPYPQNGFDMNISRYEDSYILEIASERAQYIIRHMELQEAEEKHLNEISKNRSWLIDQIKTSNSKYDSLNPKEFDISDYEESCVGCGACQYSCPVSSLFGLVDLTHNKNEYYKFRNWENMFNIELLSSNKNKINKDHKYRLAYRFNYQFNLINKWFGVFGCTGCGRCIQACSAGIDHRDILTEKVIGE